MIKVPEGVPDEEALYVSDILVTSYNQVEYTGVKEGDIVGIWGAGAIGKRDILPANLQWVLIFR